MKNRNAILRRSKGFTLIEVLTVIAIIAILSAILIPTVSQMQATARKTKDLSNMRQIINASQTFGAQNGDLMVQAGHNVSGGSLTYDSSATTAPSIGQVAAVLAQASGLNDLNIWISDSDTEAMQLNGPTPALVGGAMNPDLADTNPLDDADPENPTSSGFLSFHYVVGLNLNAPPQTPLVFTRLNSSAGSGWSASDMYKGSGGHIGFAGGNVAWYEEENPFTKLFDGEGNQATSMDSALANLPIGNNPDIAEN